MAVARWEIAHVAGDEEIGSALHRAFDENVIVGIGTNDP